MTFKEVCLGIEGLYQKNKFHHDLLGKAVSFICAAGFNGREVLKGFKKAWYGEKKSTEISQRALDELRKLKNIEAQKAANNK